MSIPSIAKRAKMNDEAAIKRGKLKHCPWCGPQVLMEDAPEIIATHGDIWWVRCEKCGTDHSSYPPSETIDQAIKAWNERY